MLELQEYRVRVGKYTGWGIGEKCDPRFPSTALCLVSPGFSLPGTEYKFRNYKMNILT